MNEPNYKEKSDIDIKKEICDFLNVKKLEHNAPTILAAGIGATSIKLFGSILKIGVKKGVYILYSYKWKKNPYMYDVANLKAFYIEPFYLEMLVNNQPQDIIDTKQYNVDVKNYLDKIKLDSIVVVEEVKNAANIKLDTSDYSEANGAFSKLTKREYAAILLKVPIGVDWLDKLILESRRIDKSNK